MWGGGCGAAIQQLNIFDISETSIVYYAYSASIMPCSTELVSRRKIVRKPPEVSSVSGHESYRVDSGPTKPRNSARSHFIMPPMANSRNPYLYATTAQHEASPVSTNEVRLPAVVMYLPDEQRDHTEYSEVETEKLAVSAESRPERF